MNRRQALVKTFGLFSATGLFLMPFFDKEEKKPYRDCVLCFDDCYQVEKFNSTMKFADQLSDITGNKSRFTYFVNVSKLFTKIYGKTNIPVGLSKKEVSERRKIIEEAINQGYEIGNHTIRHLSGKKWSEEQWFNELNEFDWCIKKLFGYKPVGFRAPYLDWNKNLYPALKKLNYLYDISIPGKFVEKRNGIIVKGVPDYIRNNGEKILGMDYNWDNEKVETLELERMLVDETKDKDLIFSMHFQEYKTEDYYRIIKQFMLKLAKSGQFRFPTMKEYIEKNYV
ncbi:MAG: polysaccharide deacetylase family protein [Candidatus Nanoarchaeia archaeon]|nr:polysaccharide deacetylase family protein [Candidatus Nanoarchaeia archaeon]